MSLHCLPHPFPVQSRSQQSPPRPDRTSPSPASQAWHPARSGSCKWHRHAPRMRCEAHGEARRARANSNNITPSLARCIILPTSRRHRSPSFVRPPLSEPRTASTWQARLLCRAARRLLTPRTGCGRRVSCAFRKGPPSYSPDRRRRRRFRDGPLHPIYLAAHGHAAAAAEAALLPHHRCVCATFPGRPPCPHFLIAPPVCYGPRRRLCSRGRRWPFTVHRRALASVASSSSISRYLSRRRAVACSRRVRSPSVSRQHRALRTRHRPSLITTAR